MLEQFFLQLSTEPESISFAQTIAMIDALYDFTPTAFSNGELHNAAGENNGSCKIFAFCRHSSVVGTTNTAAVW